MKIYWWAAIILIFIAGILLFVFIQPKNNINNGQQNTTSQELPTAAPFNPDSFSDSEKMHWMHMPLTFNFSENCTALLLSRNRRAFQEIENQTKGVVSFEEISGPADISLICHKEVPRNDIYLTSGEEQHWAQGNKIVKAVINFYNVVEGRSTLGCVSYPDVEIHEILHTFGFQHKEGYDSIMRPVQGNCLYKIDSDILAELNEIYSK